jgi:hypothetical protein
MTLLRLPHSWELQFDLGGGAHLSIVALQIMGNCDFSPRRDTPFLRPCVPLPGFPRLEKREMVSWKGKRHASRQQAAGSRQLGSRVERPSSYLAAFGPGANLLPSSAGWPDCPSWAASFTLYPACCCCCCCCCCCSGGR